MRVPMKLLGPSGALRVPALVGLLVLGVAACAGFAVLGGWVGLAGIALVLVAAIAGLLRWPA